MFSLGIRALLDDLVSTLGPERLILAYLDEIYILSNDPNALEDVQAFFATRQPSIQLNMAKSRAVTLQDARERGMQLLGSCIGPTAVWEIFLEDTIAAEEALLARLVNCPPHPPTVSTAEPVTPAAFPALRRLRTPLGTTGRVPGQFREQDPRRSVPGKSLAVENAIITLPVKLSGLGILSFHTCAPLSLAAASEASDTLLSSLLDQEIDKANQTVLSQRERCQEAFLAARDFLLESVDPQSAKSVIEGSSLLGRKSLSVISFSPAFRLTDLEVSAALHTRALCCLRPRGIVGTVWRPIDLDTTR
jgi:hypothetical protein